MFVNQHQLEYQLSRQHYVDQTFHNIEIEKLFLPGWHLVGCKADLPHEGDYFTSELLGEPLIVRRENGFHCFLNVCSHRHCKLAPDGRGNQNALTCQYHGWQYKTDGFTGKIPDAKCFRPFDRNRARLHKFRIEACGELLYVCLQENGVSLKEYLGTQFDFVQQLFDEQEFGLTWSIERDFDCNWKIPIENTVESYHLPSVHKGALAGIYPTEESQEHDLNERYSTLVQDLRIDNKTRQATRRTIGALGGKEANYQYCHNLTHPNLVFAISDLIIHAQAYIPLSPTRCRSILRLYYYKGVRRNPYAMLVRKLSSIISRKIDQTIQREDASMFDQTQLGILASRYPGCIGTREERIYTFHKYIVDRCYAAATDV